MSTRDRSRLVPTENAVICTKTSCHATAIPVNRSTGHPHHIATGRRPPGVSPPSIAAASGNLHIACQRAPNGSVGDRGTAKSLRIAANRCPARRRNPGRAGIAAVPLVARVVQASGVAIPGCTRRRSVDADALSHKNRLRDCLPMRQAPKARPRGKRASRCVMSLFCKLKTLEPNAPLPRTPNRQNGWKINLESHYTQVCQLIMTT